MFIGLTSVKVKDLNWHSIEYEMAECDDDFNSFCWSSEDIQCLRNGQVYLAADGMYFLLIITISKNLFCVSLLIVKLFNFLHRKIFQQDTIIKSCKCQSQKTKICKYKDFVA